MMPISKSTPGNAMGNRPGGIQDLAATFAVPDYGRAVSAPGSVNAPLLTTLGFDDFGIPNGLVPYGYGGNVAWQNFGFVSDQFILDNFGPDSGYIRGTVSGDTTAYNGNGTPATITSGGANFTLASAYLTAAWNDNLRVEVNAFDDGVLIYSRTYRVDNDSPRLINFNFQNIDSVTFTTSGGRPDSTDGTGLQVAFDDVTIKSSLGSISGTIFNDANANGVQDRGENGIARRFVFLDANENGILDSGETSARTNAAGDYTFRGVAFGTYDVVQVVPDGFVATTPLVAIDGYAYRAANYRWIDIADPGNALVLSNADDGSAFFESSSPISFYDQQYNDLYVSSNGFITFGTSDGAAAYVNTALPTATTPNALIAALWDDLNLGTAGHIYAVDDSLNSRIIVEWKDVALFSDPNGPKSTFEAIIGYDGSVKLQYQTVATGGTASIGVENGDGSVGTEILFGGVPGDASAYVLTPTETAISRTTVTLDSGEKQTDVDFGTTAAANAAPPPMAAFVQNGGGQHALLAAHDWAPHAPASMLGDHLHVVLA